MNFTQEDLWDTMQALGWDTRDDIAIEIGGTSVYEIDGAGTKWAPVKGTRKYNKDAFIVIKNRSRSPFVPSQAPKNEDQIYFVYQGLLWSLWSGKEIL